MLRLTPADHQVTRPAPAAALAQLPRHRIAVLPAAWLKALRLIVVASGGIGGVRLCRHPGDRVTRLTLAAVPALAPRYRFAVLLAVWLKALRLVAVASGGALRQLLPTIDLNKRTAACSVS